MATTTAGTVAADPHGCGDGAEQRDERQRVAHQRVEQPAKEHTRRGRQRRRGSCKARGHAELTKSRAPTAHYMGMLAICMLAFSANLSMLFTEVDFLQRFARASKAGFRGVECRFPYQYRAATCSERYFSAIISSRYSQSAAG